MKVNILTLFPEMFTPLTSSILGRAEEKGILDINIRNIRDYSKDKHKKADDYPFGGGNGMVMLAQPIFDALRDINAEGKKISFGRATGRHFAKYLSAFLLCVGYILVAFDDRKRGLHDMIAGTYVISRC